MYNKIPEEVYIDPYKGCNFSLTKYISKVVEEYGLDPQILLIGISQDWVNDYVIEDVLVAVFTPHGVNFYSGRSGDNWYKGGNLKVRWVEDLEGVDIAIREQF